MGTNYISEITMSMIPASKNQLPYHDYFLLDANMGQDTTDGIYYEGTPFKLMFACALFCARGQALLRINLQEFSLSRNSLLIIPPGSIIDKVDNSSDYRVGAIYIGHYDRDYLPIGKLRMRLASELKNKPLHIRLREECRGHFMASYKMIRRAVEDEGLLYRDEVIAGYMQAMAAYWLSELDEHRRTATTPPLPRNEQIFQRFIESVRKHYALHHNVGFYADQLCITPKYLAIVVTKVSGRSPLEWIHDYVILDAKAMILGGHHTIQQISDALHFPNPSFFGKFFKQKVGCPPGHFKKGHRL